MLCIWYLVWCISHLGWCIWYLDVPSVLPLIFFLRGFDNFVSCLLVAVFIWQIWALAAMWFHKWFGPSPPSRPASDAQPKSSLKTLQHLDWVISAVQREIKLCDDTKSQKSCWDLWCRMKCKMSNTTGLKTNKPPPPPPHSPIPSFFLPSPLHPSPSRSCEWRIG